MQLEPHIEALQADLASLAGLGDEAVAVAAERLSQALGPTLSLRLLEVLSEAALEVSSQLPDRPRRGSPGRAGALTRLRRGRGRARAAPSAEDGLNARITLRLPDR